MSDSELLMKFERAKTELESHISTVDMILVTHEINGYEGHEPDVGDLVDDINSLVEVLNYLLNWRLHSVKRSIRVIHEMREEQDRKEKDESEGR
jgi:hypothetical protein